MDPAFQQLFKALLEALVRQLHQLHAGLLDQIRHGHSPVQIILDKKQGLFQISLHQSVFCLPVSGLHPLKELPVLFLGTGRDHRQLLHIDLVDILCAGFRVLLHLFSHLF